MPTAFLTGATGFIGHHLLDVLLEAGWTVTAMVRDCDRARRTLGDRPGTTFVTGDLTDMRSVVDAMPESVDAVFHAAADTSAWDREKDRQDAINVGGTAAILKAMQLKGAGRLLHVSSITIFGDHRDLITEESAHLAANSWMSYARTKTQGEALVHQAIMEGFDAVIFNPTHVVGAHDTQNWARLILKMVSGDLPGAAPGSGNFANGRAVAEAIVTAYDKAPRGESYILGGPYMTIADFMAEAASLLGIAPPKKTIAPWLLKAMAEVSTLVGNLSNTRPKITREEACLACTHERASSEKAAAALGYREVPVRQSIAESIKTLKTSGLL